MEWPAGVSKAGVWAVAVGGVEAGSWNEGIAGRDLVGQGRREGWPSFVDSGCETLGSRTQT